MACAASANRRGGLCSPSVGTRRTRCAPPNASTPVVDESNDDPAFTRNRLRHELLPLLGDIGRRDPVPLLCRLAEHATEEVALLDELASAIDATDVAALRIAPPAIARRAIRAWLRPQLEGYPPDAAAVDRVLAVARGERTGTDVVAGVSVRRTKGVLRIVRA